MIELRWVKRPVLYQQAGEVEIAKLEKVLQYRHEILGVDAGMNLCPTGNWSQWIDVEESKE